MVGHALGDHPDPLHDATQLWALTVTERAGQVTGVGYRLEVRLAPADVGQRVVIRWRRPGPAGDQIADVLGILEQHDGESFAVRTSAGQLVVIPATRALAGKVVPKAPARRRREGPAAWKSG